MLASAVPSDASQALEMGADAVLVNTAIAQAKDPVLMAQAFKHGSGGRAHGLSGRPNSQEGVRMQPPAAPPRMCLNRCGSETLCQHPDRNMKPSIPITIPVPGNRPEACATSTLWELEEKVARAVTGGVNLVQLREKDLPGGQLLELADRVCARPHEGSALLFINERLDVAMACWRRWGTAWGGRSARSSLPASSPVKDSLLAVRSTVRKGALAAEAMRGRSSS